MVEQFDGGPWRSEIIIIRTINHDAPIKIEGVRVKKLKLF